MSVQMRKPLFNRIPVFWVVSLFLASLALTACASRKAPIAQAVPPRRGNADVAGQVREIIAQTLQVPEAQVAANADLRADLGADDAALAELTAALEQAFGVHITADEQNGLTTVQSVIDLIQAKSP